MSDCKHEDFSVTANVTRLTEGDDDGPVNGFIMDLRCSCTQCGINFKFVGLPKGMDLKGAAMSFDCEEAHLAISPDGFPSTSKVSGFRITEKSGRT